MQTTTDQKEIDLNGYVTYFDVPMTKIGIFPYLGKQISPELDPDKVYQVLRPKEELTKAETLKSLEAIPLVIEHTMIGEGFTPPEDKGLEGTTLKNVKVKGDLITNDLTAYTDRCKQAINDGKRDLSMGYRCRYELSSGEYNGQHYDAIQRDIIFNHIALVDEGRMGAECRIMDSAITFDSISDLLKQQKENTKMAKNFTLDEDLKEEIKEEIKEELKEEIKEDLMDGEKEEIIEEKKEEILDEEPDKKLDAGIKEVDENMAKDGDVDKRKLIDEIGGILKGKLDDELIRTIMQKAEELAYNPSETGANDACAKDKEVNNEGKKDGLSMDEALKYIAKRDDLVSKVRQVVGDSANYKSMTISQVVKYACDKLDIKPSLNCLEGYLKAVSKQKRVNVSIANDNALIFETKSAVEKRFDELNK